MIPPITNRIEKPAPSEAQPLTEPVFFNGSQLSVIKGLSKAGPRSCGVLPLAFRKEDCVVSLAGSLSHFRKTLRHRTGEQDKVGFSPSGPLTLCSRKERSNKDEDLFAPSRNSPAAFPGGKSSLLHFSTQTSTHSSALAACSNSSQVRRTAEWGVPQAGKTVSKRRRETSR